jgi:hypothetical protein
MSARFADLNRVLRELAKVPSQVAADASVSIAAEIEAQFDAGLDPYGQPWVGLSEATLGKGRFPPPLTDSGAMRGTVTVRPMPGAGISVTVDDPAVHHQYGTRDMPARPILPNAGMPDTWQRAIAEATEAALDRAAGGLRA